MTAQSGRPARGAKISGKKDPIEPTNSDSGGMPRLPDNVERLKAYTHYDAATNPAAEQLTRLGCAVIRLPSRAKKANGDWRHAGITDAEKARSTFKPEDNVGVLLGAPSGMLADVDCDCPEAVALAGEFLPSSMAVFGRASNPRSHWVCRTPEHAGGGKLATIAFKDIDKSKGKAATTLLELRVGNATAGDDHAAYTLFPGSLNASEAVEWTDGRPEEFALVDHNDLHERVHKLAAATLLVRHWPQKVEGESGTRHLAARALTGFLHRCADWNEDAIKHFIGAVARTANDEEWKSRVKTAPSDDITTPVAGRQALAEHFGSQVAARVQKWLCKEDGPEDDPRLLEMFEKYSIAMVGSKACIVMWKKVRLYDGVEYEVPAFSDEKGFRLFHRNLFIKHTGPNGNEREITLADLFIKSDKTRRYHDVVLEPDATDTGTSLNLWRGFALEPKPGEWKRMQEHMHAILANGNDAHYDYIKKWTAWAFQNPGRAAKVVLAFQGGKQAGKGIFATALVELFGAHGWHTHGAEALTGEFNEHFARCILAFWDEVLWGGDKRGEQKFKGLVTDPTLEIRPMYAGKFRVRNCLHIVAASNNEWMFPASRDEARAAVFAINNKWAGVAVPGKTDYFDALAAEIKNGGLAAMLHDLSALDLGSWCPWHNIPGTDALRDQKVLSMPPIDRLVFNLVDAGELPIAHRDSPNVAITSFAKDYGEGPNLYELFKSIKGRAAGTDDPAWVSKRLREDWGCEGWRRRYSQANSGFARGVAFPPLGELRARFEEKYGPLAWSNADQQNWRDKPVATEQGRVIPMDKGRKRRKSAGNTEPKIDDQDALY